MRRDEEDDHPIHRRTAHTSKTEERTARDSTVHSPLMLAFSWGVYAAYLYINRETLKLEIGIGLLIKLILRLLHLGM